MKKFYVVMAVIVTILVVLNIAVSGVGAAYVPPTPKSVLALEMQDAKALSNNPHGKMSFKVEKNCGMISIHAISAHVYVDSSVSPFASVSVAQDWANTTMEFKKVGDDCESYITKKNWSMTKAFSVASKDAGKAIKLGMQMQKEL